MFQFLFYNEPKMNQGQKILESNFLKLGMQITPNQVQVNTFHFKCPFEGCHSHIFQSRVARTHKMIQTTANFFEWRQQSTRILDNAKTRRQRLKYGKHMMMPSTMYDKNRREKQQLQKNEAEENNIQTCTK